MGWGGGEVLWVWGAVRSKEGLSTVIVDGHEVYDGDDCKDVMRY